MLSKGGLSLGAHREPGTLPALHGVVLHLSFGATPERIAVKPRIRRRGCGDSGPVACSGSCS